MKKLLLTISISSFMLVSCDAVLGKPEIDGDCSVNGAGTVSCTFRNDGNAKGSLCLKASLTKTRDKSYYKWSWYGDNGDSIITQGKICSGLVEPSDVKEREQFMSFLKTGELSPTDPVDFCDSDSDYSNWYDGCSFNTIEVD